MIQSVFPIKVTFQLPGNNLNKKLPSLDWLRQNELRKMIENEKFNFIQILHR